MANATHTHPTIGSLKSNAAKDGVLQFLGLQYATLADRFAPAKMTEYSTQAEAINASKLGPQVLSIAAGPDGEFGLIQQKLEYDRSTISMSDTDGLCLNIAAPASQEGSLDTNKKLPVFVFIHGGGFNVGSGMYPQYNMSKFVQLSVENGQPVVGVAINYRLGAPGLLTSKLLNEKGYLPNNTFRDQRTALLWLKQHIAGFGGDPDNITLAGESAGGISVCYHLFSKEPLFKRMISMSGTQLLMPPITPEVADANYERAIKALGLQDGDEAIEALTTSLNGNEITMRLMGAGIPYVPVLDNDLCPTPFNFSTIQQNQTSIPGHKWCEAAMAGDCQFDGNIQALRLGHRKKDIASAFCSSISSSLSSHSGLADKIFAAYDLSPSTPDDEAFEKVLRVANDLNFYVPTLLFAQNVSAAGLKMYMYRFNEPNSWEGQWKGHATHILDIAYLLQNFNDFLDEKQRDMAKVFASDVIEFVNGRSPWEEWKQAKVFGPEGKTEVVEDVPQKAGRRETMLTLSEELGEGGVDVLNNAFDAFMKGAKPPHAE